VTVSGTLQFDEAASRRSEATYMTPDVVEQRRAVRAALALGQGEKVLDIGSGAGLLAREMAAEVGAVGSVDGIDPSESMLALARRRRPPDGAAELRFGVGGCSCSTPTGARSCGIHATPSARGACWPPGMSISSTPTSLGG
jgi:protein-L-isoaspartate O-methyltransferase